MYGYTIRWTPTTKKGSCRRHVCKRWCWLLFLYIRCTFVGIDPLQRPPPPLDVVVVIVPPPTYLVVDPPPLPSPSPPSGATRLGINDTNIRKRQEGSALVSGSRDNTVKIWDVASACNRRGDGRNGVDSSASLAGNNDSDLCIMYVCASTFLRGHVCVFVSTLLLITVFFV